jgi:hypothetical protein
MVGTNVRYAAQIDAKRDEKINEIVMRDHQPQSLTPNELELDLLPLTRTPKPIPAIAWVHYDKMALKIPVHIVAWTPRACAIKWTTPQGREEKVWVWASAVDRE